MAGLDKSSITFGVWNIDGLYKRINRRRVNKLLEGDIFDSIKHIDILMLIETHCTYQNAFHVPGYSIHNQIRPKSQGVKKHHDGISILIKNDIRPGITYLPSNNSELLWFKLNRSFFKLPYDLFVLAVYVCPENSSYAGKSGDIFQLLESDIAKYSQQGKCLVFGDFNGRTRNEPDYWVNDDVLSLYLPPDGSSLTDIPLIRNNCDISDVDKNGKQLLELCKGSGLRIMNGRIFGDSLGYHTCFSKNGNPSTTDYFLCSPEILDTSRFLRVETPSTDSIHCLLSLSISTKLFSTIPIPNEHLHMEDISNFSWDSFSQQRFEEVVARHAPTFDVPNTLCNPTPDSVDDIIKKFNIFITLVP